MPMIDALTRGVAAAALVAAAGLAAGCGGDSGDEASATSTPSMESLAQFEWVASKVADPDFQQVDDSAITLTFAEDAITAQAGCNTLSGAASIEGSNLVVPDQLASTMKACEQALTEQDQWLAAFLTSSPKIEWDGEDFWLTHEKTRVDFMQDN